MRSHLDNCRSVLIKWIFIPIVWLTLGVGPAAPDRHHGQPAIQPTNLRPGQFMLLAADEGNPTAGDAASTTGSDSDVSKSERSQNTEPGGQSAKPGTMPLKPFTPSEEIPAEQAVDFPVDI